MDRCPRCGGDMEVYFTHAQWCECGSDACYVCRDCGYAVCASCGRVIEESW